MLDKSTKKATAVFTAAFQFPGAALDPHAPELIERDRVIMARRPGMVRKLLPLRVDSEGVYCGGCYLFDTYENARAYGDWMKNEFSVDGVKFFDRFAFMEPTAQVWHIAGIEDFADVETAQQVMRFQRWHIAKPTSLEELKKRWPALRDRAKAGGLAAIWLLYSPDPHHPQLGVVSVAPRRQGEVARNQPNRPTWLEGTPSPADELAAELHGTEVFDRTSWVYMIWYPIVGNATPAETALWPNSPPLPNFAAPLTKAS
jgi:hypothetical protein